MPGGDELKVLELAPPTPEAKRLWEKALELASAFGPDEPWCLIGGLMVQLYATERETRLRPTGDIDVLGDSRRRPSMTERLAAILAKRGGRMATPPLADEKLGMKFEIDGEVVEVLGSEGVPSDPRTIGAHTTFQVPGGTQALRRTEKVGVSLDGAGVVILRRPTLLGAILIKARALASRRGPKFESDRQDLALLLSIVEDPRALIQKGNLKRSEKRWLRKIEHDLDLEDPGLRDLFSEELVVRAEQAFRLLTT